MKFIFADALDMVDPGYDFTLDRASVGREPYWDDKYPHEVFGRAPYDGVLVSRAIVGDSRFAGKYTAAQSMRFHRVGAREFLRLSGAPLDSLPLFGDCGAFSYASLQQPPYKTDDTLDFYADGQFTHGCSVDHVIFDFDPSQKGLKGASATAKQRWDITLSNAASFLKAASSLGKSFTPMGVVQGWSPDSKALAAQQLERMGYRYLAVGGMVPLSAKDIHACLAAIRSKISPRIKLHLLGFAKADNVEEFQRYGIASFDSSSPLIRAFKDARSNYYLPNGAGKLKYYTAIRIPQSTENARLTRKAKAGSVNQETLQALETKALRTLREFDSHRASLKTTLDSILEYHKHLDSELKTTAESFRQRYEQTLEARPWKSCTCTICAALSVEVVIFRTSNRNKRRGFHNLFVYHEHLKRIINRENHGGREAKVPRDLRSPA
ncbi:MAG TPA: tRNA-guanine transglycosylase DpdA [Usitatibacter sp.]|nr:tRNA-guanine transglycosylase DpdA [Usitatibacter sp.]